MHMTTGRSNLTERPHRRRKWTLQSYLLGGANVRRRLTYASLGSPESISKQHFDRFSRFCTAHGRDPYTLQLDVPLPPQNSPFTWGIWTRHLIHGSLSPLQSSPQPKRHLDRFSRFCRAHDRDRETDRPRYSACNNGPHL